VQSVQRQVWLSPRYGTLPSVAYHEAVWAAATASAPVIALANLVAIGDSYTVRYMFARGLRKTLPEWRLVLGTRGGRIAGGIYAVAAANLFVQMIITVSAFESLINTSDWIHVSLVPGAEG